MRSLHTFPDRRAKLHTVRRWFFGGMMAVCLSNTVLAINPNRAMSQYIRDQWGAEKGFPGGAVNAITQTTDGYLWIGTEKGLVRFDGVTFRLFQHGNTPLLPAGPVLGLAADAEGNLWIRTQSPRLLRYHDRKFHDVQTDLKRDELGITAMCRGNNGEILFSALLNGVLRYSGGKFIPLASLADRPNFLVLSMAETRGGDIWLGTRDAGLYRLRAGQMTAVTVGLSDPKINCLLLAGDQHLWVGTDNGLVGWNGTQLTSDGVPSALRHIQTLAMIRDRDANLWIATAAHGLLRFNSDGVTALEESRPQAGKAVTALFEDREGNLWIGNAQGLERWRDSTFTTFSPAEGLPSATNGPIFADSQNRLWFAPADGGLYWLHDKEVRQVTAAGLDRDVVYSIAGDGDEVWIGRQQGGLTQLRFQGGLFSARTYTQANGLAQNSVYAVYRSRDGSVWAGTLSGGVSKLRAGRFTTYTSADGLASNTVAAIEEGFDGTMWFATPNGLSALSNGRWQNYTTRDGLPSANINCLLTDSAGVLWLGTGEGVANLRSGRVEALREMPVRLREPIVGMAEDKKGTFWIATTNRVLSVTRAKLLDGKLSDGDLHEYGLSDGLASIEGVKRSRTVVADAIGRIWLSLARGLSVADSSYTANATPPVLVAIQEISADGRHVDPGDLIRIPSIRQRLTFSFAGLSLSVPEQVKFRYWLEGFDGDWSEPISVREATYTNLGPGTYRFRVLASNSESQWDGPEAIMRFEIEPAYWQTWWFRLAGVLTCSLVILGVYRLRLRQLTRQMNLRFEAQLAERMRIAQDLHDTLLQGCISASMQLHVVADQLATDSLAKPMLSRVVQLMGQVIEDGRNAVRGLRSAQSELIDLEQSFSRIQQELGMPSPSAFRVLVEGQPRPLHPILRDEVYRIGREALVNAFRHSHARNIEVALEYTSRHLRIFVRDDGCGIDSQVLRSGRDGHWGLSGMRERAERIGARLNVRSRAAAGTEVELSVPGQIAFQLQPSSRLPKWLSLWLPRKASVPATGTTTQASDKEDE